ncbi:MAG TPA: hypothetical protein VMM56_01000 [Planctomycetaceae bacterium]|nr:hypothetical protein [Planctomycetaceae bacterium]
MRQFLILLLIVTGTAFSLRANAQDNSVRQASQEFERAVLSWVSAEGTPGENAAYEKMAVARAGLVAYGTKALDEITLLLEHKHENVRRGTAIVLLSIVTEHNLESQILLDKILLRMVEDPDQKTRHNLYHVSRKLIFNIRRSDRVEIQAAESTPAAPRN